MQWIEKSKIPWSLQQIILYPSLSKWTPNVAAATNVSQNGRLVASPSRTPPSHEWHQPVVEKRPVPQQKPVEKDVIWPDFYLHLLWIKKDCHNWKHNGRHDVQQDKEEISRAKPFVETRKQWKRLNGSALPSTNYSFTNSFKLSLFSQTKFLWWLACPLRLHLQRPHHSQQVKIISFPYADAYYLKLHNNRKWNAVW